jgi:hypothetical protein
MGAALLFQALTRLSYSPRYQTSGLYNSSPFVIEGGLLARLYIERRLTAAQFGYIR